jgi:glycogen operon protein
VIWCNAGAEPVQVCLPDNQWVRSGEIVLTTAPDLSVGTPVVAGDQLTLSSRSVLVLRQT